MEPHHNINSNIRNPAALKSVCQQSRRKLQLQGAAEAIGLAESIIE